MSGGTPTCVMCDETLISGTKLLQGNVEHVNLWMPSKSLAVKIPH